ncbi:leucine-rich repeat domain-containing protein [Mucilaginibacter celer]|uniref:leucine-rich repeat domain-containing protein n=1 Tax=Mucilaginibacter celer TaxID=2305508 RepID=UPI003CCB4F93
MLYLNIKNNQITAIPDRIGRLKKLQKLYLDGNPISPDNIRRIHELLPDCIRDK